MVLDIKRTLSIRVFKRDCPELLFFKLVHPVAACSKREENSRTRRGDCMVVRCAAWRIAPLVAQVFESIGDRILGKVASQRSRLLHRSRIGTVGPSTIWSSRISDALLTLEQRKQQRFCSETPTFSTLHNEYPLPFLKFNEIVFYNSEKISFKF